MDKAARDTNRLYQVLGLSKDATIEEIKRSYKRLALINHPDKNPENLETFKEIKHAYDILSDLKKRSIYDRYGEWGINMSDSVGAPFFDPKFESKVGLMFFIASLITILAIIFFSFLSQRVDKLNDWKYAIVFTPLWIIDVVLLAPLFMTLKSTLSDWNKFRSKSDQSDDINDSDPAEPRSNKEFALTMAIVGVLTIYLTLFTVFQVLIVLKVDDQLAIPASQVFIPIYIMEAFVFLRLAFAYFIYIKIHKEDTILKKLARFFGDFWLEILRITQIGLLVAKLDNPNMIDVSWGLVFLPMYLLGIKYLLSLIWGFHELKKMPESQERSANKAMLILFSVMYGIVAAFGYSFIGMLAFKLDYDQSITMAVVLIPVFIVLALLLCCCGCCLPCCFYVVLHSDVGDDLADQAVAAWAPPNRLITQGQGEDHISSMTVPSFASNSPLNPSSS